MAEEKAEIKPKLERITLTYIDFEWKLNDCQANSFIEIFSISSVIMLINEKI